jgi:beta-1,4-mannosyltransferase
MRILARPGTEIGEANPYTKLLYEPMRGMGHTVEQFDFFKAFTQRYDILHIHWPEYFIAHPSALKAIVGSLGTLLAMQWLKMRGAKVVWTAHNLHSHHGPRPRIERRFWRAFIRRVDTFIAMSERGREEAEEEFPRMRSVRSFVIPHGHYRGAYPNVVSKRKARESLGVPGDASVVCFLGSIAPYKGLPELISAFREVPQAHLRLLIAGASDHSQETAALRKQADSDGRVIFHAGFVPTEHIQIYLNAADLVVMPFRKTWNSGSAMLALSFDRPILVPARGAFFELAEQIGSEWIRTYQGSLSAEELQAALDWATANRRPAAAPLDKFDWNQIAESTLRCYEELASPHATEIPALMETGREHSA